MLLVMLMDFPYDTVDGSEIMQHKNPVKNDGINYQPQLVSQISEPSTIVLLIWV